MAYFLWLLPLISSHVAASLQPLPRQCQVVQHDAICSDLNLRSMPDGIPNGVQRLDLSGNMLQNLTYETLAYHSSFHLLNLHANKIQYIQPGLFKDMKNLRILDLSRNHLDIFARSKIGIGPLAAVESLDLSSNGLYTGMTDYVLGYAPALHSLSLKGNSITTLTNNTFSSCPALRRINLHNNVILEIENGAFEMLFHLTELDLSKNSITCITDFDLCKLEVLNLSKNSLETFQTPDSPTLYKLTSIDLSENKMVYFPLLPKRNQLIYLNVSRNMLQSVNTTGTIEEMANIRDTCSTLTPSGRPNHQNFSRLIHLDLSYNQIKSIPESFFCTMGSLEVLNVSNNCIGSFYVNQKGLLKNLKILDLSYNPLQNFSFGIDALLSLENLFLQGNGLTTMDPQIFQRLPSITYLHLQQNNLKICAFNKKQTNKDNPPGCVYLSSISTLQFLYFSENELEVLPEYAFYNTPLMFLDLSLNPGLHIDQHSLCGLENSLVHILLKENNISKLNTDLSLLSSLKFVDLSNNKLTTLPFWNKESLIESLNLQNNNLVSLEHNTVLALERSLKTLYMGANPLRCCSNLGFLHMVQRSNVVVPDIASVTCVYLQDTEPVNIESVTQEMCESQGPQGTIAIVVVVILLVIMLVITKLCYKRKRKHSRSFNA